jgi:hypothetical protein
LIHEKIQGIRESLVIEKTGYDERDEYYYFKADDVANGVRKAMIEHGVVHRTVIQSYEQDNHWDTNGRNRPRITALATVSFIDIEDNSFLDTQVVATGSDVGGDKAPRKMMVQIFKEAAIDVFTISEGMQSMDSDAFAEAEPDVAEVTKEDQAEAKKLDSKALGARVTEMINDPELEHVDSEMIIKVGRRVSKGLLGETPGDRVWRKDARVLEAVIKAIENGEVE